MAKASTRKAKAEHAALPSLPTLAAVSPEETARRTLAWGAGALILGLAVVGIGSEDLGVLPALAGLLLLVYGIHRYGRLGPEEEPARDPANPDLEAAQSTVWTGIWMSGLVTAAGLAVALGSAGGAGMKVVIAYGAVLGGGFRLIRGLSALSRLRQGPVDGGVDERADERVEKRVEKRRRMNKSAPP